jgi:hypothetical protein
MLQIRQSQMKLFSDAEVRKYEDWVVAHVRKFFPNASSHLTESQLRDLIRYGIRRAASNGIRSRPNVCKYIDLMVLLGRDFDVDSQYPWAARALRDWKSETGRIDALFRGGKREEAKLKGLTGKH